MLGTSSIDTTCTVWGLETGQVLGRSVSFIHSYNLVLLHLYMKVLHSLRVNMVSGHVKPQLIAHDKEVYDIAFSKAGGGRDMFASVGADGRFG